MRYRIGGRQPAPVPDLASSTSAVPVEVGFCCCIIYVSRPDCSAIFFLVVALFGQAKERGMSAEKLFEHFAPNGEVRRVVLQ